MPSGSRKRKAAKKKKENQSYDMLSTASAQPPCTNDDVKIQDDEVTALEEDNVMPHNPSVEEPQLEVGEDSNLNPTHKEDVSSERDEAETRSHDGDSSSESTNGSIISINSDDESHGIKTGSYDAIDTAQPVDVVKTVLSLPEKEDVTTSVFEDVLDSMVGNISTQEKDLAFEHEEEVHVISSSDDNINGTSATAESETMGHGEEQPRILEDNIDTTADVIEENNARLTQLCDEPVVLDEELEVPETFTPNNSRQPAQTTSLKSCCGLFEVFTGYGG